MKKTNLGQSLIEVIVVLLLISISLTGMVSTMLTSQQLSRSAIQTSDAVNLATNLSNKMRLNLAELNDKQSRYLAQLDDSKVISVICSEQNNCDQRLQALSDLAQWQTQLKNKLPNYQAIICRDSTPQDGHYMKEDGCDNRQSSSTAIKIWWTNKQEIDDSAYFYTMVHTF